MVQMNTLNAQSSKEDQKSLRERIDNYTELPKLLLSIMKQLGEVMAVERASLFLHDPQSKQLWSAVSSEEDIDKICFPDDKGIAGHVMMSKTLLNIPDAYADPRFNPDIDHKTGFKTHTILCVPVITYDDHCIGVVQVINKHNQETFSTLDEKMLCALGSQSAVAIENMQLREREKDLAEELAKNHRQLQDAYLSIENSNASLQSRLAGKLWGKRLAGLFLLLVVLGFGGWFILDTVNLSNLTAQFKGSSDEHSATMDDQSFKRLTLSTREVTDWLRLKGSIKPVEWIEIVSSLDAVVTKMNFRYGDIVTQGQHLLTLDTTQLQVQLRDANSSHITALNEVNRLKNWPKSLEVLRAKRDVAKARENLNQAKRKLKETKRLFDKGIIARSELENAQTAVKENQIGVMSARESLQSTLSQGNKSKLTIAQLKLENAEQKLNELKEQIKQAVIYSPASGIIFAGIEAQAGKDGKTARKSHVGSSVSRNSPLLAIADFRGISIESNVSESLVLKLKRGQTVKVAFDALPNLQMDGEINFIAGRGSKGNSHGASSSTFKVSVIVPEISNEQRQLLRIGMSATARVVIYHNADAIVVPFEAVQSVEDEHFVQLESQGRVQRKSISIRSSQPDGVEVEQGLSVGDVVLISERHYQKRTN